MEMNQNQIFFSETYSNLTSFFIAHKVLKYCNGFLLRLEYSSLIAKVSTNKLSEVRLNRLCANLTVFSLIYKVIHYSNDCWNLFLIRFISKINDNSSERKMSFVYFHSVKVEENWALQYLNYHKNILIILLWKRFKNIYFAFSIKIMLCYLKFHFKQ